MSVQSFNNVSNTAKPARPAANAPAAPKPGKVGGGHVVMADSLQLSNDKPRTDAQAAIAAINDAAALPPMPSDAAGKAAWLQDGYKRLAKAELSEKVLEDAERTHSVSFQTASDAIFKRMDLSEALRKADPGGVVEKQFYGAAADAAIAQIDALPKVPQPPKDVAGMKAWLAKYEPVIKQGEAARAIVQDAWMSHGISMDVMTRADRKLSDLTFKADLVRDTLNPPPPLPPGKPGAWRPFGATQGVSEMLDKHHDPISQTAGAVALPLALTFDLLDLITKPFELLDKATRKQ